jgi:hypothetical protein
MLTSIRQALGDGSPLKDAEHVQEWAKWQADFDKALANPAREPEVGHNPTVKAALFLMHDPTLADWLKPGADNLVARLLKLESPSQLADELYVAVLSRPPTDEEQAALADYVAARSERRERAVANLAWSLIASNEFCANH